MSTVAVPADEAKAYIAEGWRAADSLATASGISTSELLWRLQVGHSEARASFRHGAPLTPEAQEALSLLPLMGKLPEPPEGGDTLVRLTFNDSHTATSWPAAETIRVDELCRRLTDHQPGEKEGSCVVPVTSVNVVEIAV